MSKKKLSGKRLVIQFGRYMTQIVLVNAKGHIQHAATVSTPLGAVEDGMIQDMDALRDMLKETLRSPEFKRTYEVVFTLSTSQVISETVVVPEMPAARLEKLLEANVDMYFPVDMRDYRMVWQTIGPVTRDAGMKELAVQLWAVPRDMLAKYYKVGNAAGLNVLAIDYCGHSIATAVGASFQRPAKTGKAKTRKKLDLNAEISFGRKKKEEAIEPVMPAGEDRLIPDTVLHLTLERDLLGMTFVQENQVVHQRFVPCGENPAYQFGEIGMMLEYFRSLDVGRGSEIRGVLNGTLSRNARLIQEMSDILGISLVTLDSDFEPRLAMSYGAARTELDFGIADLNKPTRARNQLEGQLWQFALILAGGAALIAAVMLLLSARLLWNSSISSLKSTQQTLSIQAQKYAGFADNYKSYSSQYDNYSRDWDNIFSNMRTYNNNLVLALQELEDTLPEKSSVVGLQINPDGWQVSFACETKEEAAFLIMALRELEYAELAMITDLQGGGGGAATDYGNGEEEPPAEGSSTLTNYQRNQVLDKIHDTSDQDKVWEFVANLKAADADLIQTTYGKAAPTANATIADAKAQLAPTFARRSEAMAELLTRNFYAIYEFTQLVQEDMDKDEPALWTYLVDDLLMEENEDLLNFLMSTGHKDGKLSREYNLRLVELLIQDEAHLSAAEDLLTADSAVAKWYVFYLETAAADYDSLRLPYFNTDVLVDDLAAGGFDTSSRSLNEQLNGLIHQSVWTLLESFTAVDPAYPDQFTDLELYNLLSKYDQNGTTGDASLDKMIKDKVEKGTSGNTRLDEMMNEYEPNNPPTEKPADKPNNNPQPTEPKPTTKPTEPEDDDDVQDGQYAEMLNQLSDAQLGLLINKYLSTGSTGMSAADEVIEKYLETGTTGDKIADARIEGYLVDLIEKYNKNGTTGIKSVDSMINKYKTSKTTGYKAMDKLLTQHLDIKQLVGGLTGTGTGTGTGNTTGGGGGGGGQAQDTRIFFTAVLLYRENLIDAELSRKGLDQNAKVEKLEVGE